MSRLPYPDVETLSDATRHTLHSMPVSLNILRMVSHLDEACPAMLQLGAKILTVQKLSPVLRELVILRVAQLSDAEYEWVQHEAFANDVGVTQAQIDALQKGERTGDCFTELEALVLAFADEVVQNVRPSDQVLAALREHLSDREVMEITAAIGFYMMMARFMEVSGVDVDAPGGLQIVQALNAKA
ncbi:MAG TPA: carboxymuconolactone decarboxylase family protein [Sneathiellales bacterium]|jgi:alkylhydroperoxidase family enzyme|nr:carboxymuconolactone decarboxylase family protein [Sneathiellales bacterium]